MLVGRVYAASIYPLHAREVDQGAQHGLHCATPAFHDGLGLRGLQAVVHLVVKRLVHAVGDGLEIALADALGPQRAVSAHKAAAAIDVHVMAIMVHRFTLVGQHGLLAAFLCTLVPVLFFIVNKPFFDYFRSNFAYIFIKPILQHFIYFSDLYNSYD